MYCDTKLPAATPIRDVATSARDAPRNTVIKFPGALEANRSVASCVLSPSSARKIVPNTELEVLIVQKPKEEYLPGIKKK